MEDHFDESDFPVQRAGSVPQQMADVVYGMMGNPLGSDGKNAGDGGTKRLEDTDASGQRAVEMSIDASSVPSLVQEQYILERNTRSQKARLEHHPMISSRKERDVSVNQGPTTEDVAQLFDIVRNIFLDAHNSGVSMQDQFTMFDRNDSGTISQDEFAKGLIMLGVHNVGPSELALLMERFRGMHMQARLDGQESKTMVCDEKGVRYRSFMKAILGGFSSEKSREELLLRIRAAFMKEILEMEHRSNLLDPTGNLTLNN
jgi:hypothetical protein